MISRSIRLISPSGYCHNQPAALLGVERLRAAGHQVDNQQVITRRFQRFAGTDAERLADINQLATLSWSIARGSCWWRRTTPAGVRLRKLQSIPVNGL